MNNFDKFEYPSFLFDPDYYLSEYEDLGSLTTPAEQHFQRFGISEDRKPNRYFDPKFYRSTYRIPSETPAFTHFVTTGVHQHLDPSIFFSHQEYLAAYSKDIEKDVPPFYFFLKDGIKLGHSGRPTTHITPTRCWICSGATRKIFQKAILQKYDVDFFRCARCGFMQTVEPTWLEEAYASPLVSFDTGAIRRPIESAVITEDLINTAFNPTARFLDYGGAYGVFTRIMRDKGYDFYRQDKYAENLFARHFDIEDLPPPLMQSTEGRHPFELITAFEVAEHLPQPLDTFAELFKLGKNLLLSTDLQPILKDPSNASELSNWWYLCALEGQHVSFYTHESMLFLAKKFKRNYTTFKNFHLFTDEHNSGFDNYRIKKLSLWLKNAMKLNFPHKKKSFTEKDAEFIKNLIVTKADTAK